jgi:hypothetical protein
MAVNNKEVPPAETIGMGCPVTGMAPTDTNMLIRAWVTIEKESPAEIKPPKGLSQFLMTLKLLRINSKNNPAITTPITMLYSSMMMAKTKSDSA